MKNKDRKGKKKLKYIKPIFYQVLSYLSDSKFECLSLHHRGPLKWSFPGGSMLKNLSANAGDMDLISEWGRYPWAGSSNQLQYSCQENPMERGAWRAAVHGVAQSQMQLSTHTCFLKTKFKTLLQSKVTLEFSIKWISVIKILYWYNFK